jgi:hypothetical protein
MTIFATRVRATRAGADRLPYGLAWVPTAPAVRIRRRCDTYTNFDSNRAPLNTIARPGRLADARKLAHKVLALLCAGTALCWHRCVAWPRLSWA